MELKTLKDFDTLIVPVGQESATILIKELRQEAIKWYLHLNDCPSGIKYCKFCIGTQMFIQKFFNLTSEDLK